MLRPRVRQVRVAPPNAGERGLPTAQYRQVTQGSTMAGPGFTVIDFETTGSLPEHHRVVEITAVHIDLNCESARRCETLIEPRSMMLRRPTPKASNWRRRA